MTWGEVVNAVRSFHLELIEQLHLSPKVFMSDVDLNRLTFPYPEPSGEYNEWNPITVEPSIQEALEMNSVERVLIEGPLLPIQEIKIQTHDLDQLYQAVVTLEKEWLEKTKQASDQTTAFTEQSLKQKWLKLQTRAGLNRLKAV